MGGPTATLFDFGFFHDYDAILRTLASRAQSEDWKDADVPGREPHPHGALRSYLDHMYRRLVEEGRVLTSGMDERGRPCAMFNTGLLTDQHRFIYGVFKPEQTGILGRIPWVFVRWATEEEPLIQSQLRDDEKRLALRPAWFFSGSPGELFFRPGASIQFNEEHFLSDHLDRLPKSFLELDKPEQLRVLRASFHFTERLVQMNWRVAVPFYRHDHRLATAYIQLLLPLYLSPFYEDEDAQPNAASEPDCVAILDPRYNGTEFIGYYVPTKLTLSMARKNARLLGRFSQPWLG